MSLIQEALKRQQEEQDPPIPAATPAVTTPPKVAEPPPPATPAPPAPRPEPPPAPKPPAAPAELKLQPAAAPAPSPAHLIAPIMAPPAPEQVLEQPGRKKRGKPWIAVLGMFLLLILLLGGGIYLIFFAFEQWASPRTKTTVAHTQPGPAPVKPATPRPVVRPATPAPVTPPSAPAPATPTPATPAAPAPVAPAPVAPTPVVRPAVPVTPATPVAVAAPTPVAPTPVSVKPPVEWPLLTITGVVGQGARGSAIINGEILGVAEVIEGVRIVGIKRQGVDLELEGERQYVKVGGSTR